MVTNTIWVVPYDNYSIIMGPKTRIKAPIFLKEGIVRFGVPERDGSEGLRSPSSVAFHACGFGA